ncbi:MAG: sigma-70 family RNA polymerase sigma factor [Faecousia sp.]
MSWLEDWDHAAEDAEKEELDYFLSEEDLTSTDEIIWDKDTCARLENEWNPAEDTEQDVCIEDDPVLRLWGDVPENADDPSAPISESTILEQLDEISVERLEDSARTEKEFLRVCREWDRLDANRRRRERYHEILQDVLSPTGSELYGGRIFPSSLDAPEQKLILQGMFLDLLYNCPYEMHQLTGDAFLSKIVENLSADQKEVLYFLSLQLYSTARLASVREQSDRNIRKVRDTYTRKLQRQLYGHLRQKKEEDLTNREREFLFRYAEALEEKGTSRARVKKETKYPKRKKAAHTDGGVSVWIGGAL